MSKHGKYVLTLGSFRLALNPTVYVAIACIVHPLYTDKVSGTKSPEKLYRLKRKINNRYLATENSSWGFFCLVGFVGLFV